MKAILALTFLSTLLLAHAADSSLSLAGAWRFQLDPDRVGLEENWHTETLDDTITLPGTTDTNRKGIQRDERPIDRLARPFYWKGPAWYQRDITIPASWAGKRVVLYLERTKHTQVWVDDQYFGWDNSLSAPHVHDLGDSLAPGEHTITLLIDNSRLPPVGPSHQVDERTQTNWNGVVGQLELRATDPIWIDDAQAYPSAAEKKAKIRVVIGNATGAPAKGSLKLAGRTVNIDPTTDLASQQVAVVAEEKWTTVEFTYEPGPETPLWDEFQPALLELDLTLDTQTDARSYQDHSRLRFGMRDFTADRNRLRINGQGTFLRGRLDCANYPLTGYAPMSLDEWRRILSIMQDWGLNHVRFHSWCPPRAAFVAADELGMYLQPEFPNKRSAFDAPDDEDEDAAYHNIDRLDIETSETDVSLYDYAKRESELIFKHFGNHPSFVMYTLGNELGRRRGMFELVDHFQTIDPRRLYAQGANNMHWNPSLAEGDDFWVIGRIEKDGKPVRGSYYIHDYDRGPVNVDPPSTLDDFSRSIEGIPVPVIGHETGQYQVYPDFGDIDQFTGVLKGENYKIFRERLTAAGMLDQADDFVQASGKLAAICYREDIEIALRTPGFGGFQLLDIMDFPGQSTALVGMLDVFMEPKGFIDADQWRQFCSETVPLVRMKKHAWTTSEMLQGRIDVAHYGSQTLDQAQLVWTLTGADGAVLQEQSLAPTEVPQGDVSTIDFFSIPLDTLAAPQRLDLQVRIEGTPYQNRYPVWVYPPAVDPTPADGVRLSRQLSDPATRQHLEQGGRVVLIPKLDELPASVGGSFQTEFWSPMFARSARRRELEEPPGTLGHLCDPAHPALAGFPTESHSNWQWWHLVKNSRPIILDETPDDYRPIIQVIDNFDRNHKLGLLFETRYGQGSLLVCPIDLIGQSEHPEVRQFLQSLLDYAASDAFDPTAEIPRDLLEQLLPG